MVKQSFYGQRDANPSCYFVDFEFADLLKVLRIESSFDIDDLWGVGLVCLGVEVYCHIGDFGFLLELDVYCVGDGAVGLPESFEVFVSELLDSVSLLGAAERPGCKFAYFCVVLKELI